MFLKIKVLELFLQLLQKVWNKVYDSVMLTFIAEGGTGDAELTIVVCCGIGKRKHEALPGCDAIL